MKAKASLLCILLLIISTAVYEDTAAETHGTPSACGLSAAVSSSAPVSTVDTPITLRVSGEWPNSCVPTYDTHTINGNTIRIDAVWDYAYPVCLQILTPWSFDLDLGQLPAGTYHTELYITYQGTNLCATDTFYVFEQILESYLPMIHRDG